MQDDLFSPKEKNDGYYTCDRKRMLKFVPNDAVKILEIGCGSGMFGYNLKSIKEREVWGVELSKVAAQDAAKRLDKVIIGDIENDNISLPDNYFDCVIFNDVLEHLRYPWIVLKEMKNYIKDDGCVVASIPNVRYFHHIKDLLKHKEWKYVNEGILDKTHLRFFTNKSIEEMFLSCGYKILTIEGINGIEFPWKFRIFNRIMNRTFEDMRFLQFACVVQKNKHMQ